MTYPVGANPDDTNHMNNAAKYIPNHSDVIAELQAAINTPRIPAFSMATVAWCERVGLLDSQGVVTASGRALLAAD